MTDKARLTAARKRRPDVAWLLFDIDNGDYWDNRGYVWWFRTRSAALEHKKWQAEQKHCATLIGPYKYFREKA